MRLDCVESSRGGRKGLIFLCTHKQVDIGTLQCFPDLPAASIPSPYPTLVWLLPSLKPSLTLTHALCTQPWSVAPNFYAPLSPHGALVPQWQVSYKEEASLLAVGAVLPLSLLQVSFQHPPSQPLCPPLVHTVPSYCRLAGGAVLPLSSLKVSVHSPPPSAPSTPWCSLLLPTASLIRAGRRRCTAAVLAAAAGTAVRLQHPQPVPTRT